MALANREAMATTASTPISEDPSTLGAHAGPARRGSRVGRVLRTLLLAIVMAALGYLGGWIHGGIETARVRDQAVADAAEQERSLASLRETQASEIAAARARSVALTELSALYEALRMGHHALGALDERNFGVAETRLREMERQLAPPTASTEGVPALIEKLRATNIEIAGDLGEQRGRVLGLVGQLDDIVSKRREQLAQ